MKKDPHYSEKFRQGSKIKCHKVVKVLQQNSYWICQSVFQKYLISQAKSSEIMAAYQARRAFFAIHLLISTGSSLQIKNGAIIYDNSGLFYMVYFQDERHEFNCELEWDANLLIRPLVLCNMQGVQIRRLIVAIICIVNLILVFIVIYCFIQRSVNSQYKCFENPSHNCWLTNVIS